MASVRNLKSFRLTVPPLVIHCTVVFLAYSRFSSIHLPPRMPYIFPFSLRNHQKGVALKMLSATPGRLFCHVVVYRSSNTVVMLGGMALLLCDHVCLLCQFG